MQYFYVCGMKDLKFVNNNGEKIFEIATHFTLA